MGSTRLRIDGHEIRMYREVIDVSSALPGPDPSWRYTDTAGHEHCYDDGYPTLELVTVSEPYWCPDCHEEHEGDTELRCRLCGEQVTPGTRVSSNGQAMAWRVEYYIDDEPATEVQVRVLMERL